MKIGAWLRRHRFTAALAGVAAAALIAVPSASYVYELGGGESCARCHEIAPNFESWRHSTHAWVDCTECHGGAVTLNPEFHFGNIRRLAVHVGGQIPEQIRLRPGDLKPMGERCKRCHEQEFRRWQAGAHSATYARIFATAAHNNKRLLMDDCMRCHGMHFQGSIDRLVSPVSMDGPWRVRDVAPEEPAIPCLSCHAIHVDASDAKAGFYRIASPAPGEPTGITAAKMRPSLALFDRRTQDHIPANLLPVPAIQNSGQPIRVSRSPQSALCYQCHAPYGNMQAGTNDDKTPTGPYAGMACLDCHEKHSLKASQPCGGFHDHPERCLDAVPPPAPAITSPSPR